jgi:diaminohydroxyphosphoribosylaminopyrimidine deaminase/5-amino-6-(5-phosphoribosylamino)uracil reductase
MVGAVVVRDGTVVGEGYHARFGDPHAEAAALKAAGERARAATMYVTLEPCNHFGKTPPCTEAILQARVKRVAIAAADPTALAGGGARHLADYGVQVDFGVEEAAALELNAPFFFSSDGKMNDPSGERRWITSELSRKKVQHMRANVDAIAVGLGTVRADDPQLTARGSVRPRIAPMRVIFDRNAETPLEAIVVKSAKETPTVIFAHHPPVARLAALHNAGVDVFEAEDLAAALRALRGFEVQHLLVEGGARVAQEFLRQEMVDRLVIFQSTAVLGATALSPFYGLPESFQKELQSARVVRRAEFAEDVMTEYALREG